MTRPTVRWLWFCACGQSIRRKAVSKLNDLYKRKTDLVKRIRELADQQENWDAQQQEEWDQRNTDVDQVNAEIAQEEASLARASRAAELEGELASSRRGSNLAQRQAAGAAAGGDGADLLGLGALPDSREAIRRQHQALYLWARRDRLTRDQRNLAKQLKVDLRATEFVFQLPSGDRQNRSVSCNNGTSKVDLTTRDLGIVTPGAGQETVPEGFLYELEVALLSFGGTRNVARILRTATGNPLPAPTADDTTNASAILVENTSIGASVDPSFAQIVFGAYKFSSTPILVAEELMQDSAFNMAAELGRMIGTRIGRGQAPYFAEGTGTGQPEGILNCPAGKVATSPSALTGDELIDMQHSVDPAYRAAPACAWVMHDTTVSVIRKLADSTGQYLWQPGLQAGVPDRLLGNVVAIDNSFPVPASNAKVIAYGDMSKFVIRDAGDIRFYRLNELYRGTDQTGFVAFLRSDSKLHDAGTNPIKHLAMGA